MDGTRLRQLVPSLGSSRAFRIARWVCRRLARIGHEECSAEGYTGVRFAARVAGFTVGWATLSMRPPSAGARAGAWLVDLRVRRAFRRMGFGTDLCRAVLDAARCAGAGSLQLTVQADRLPAICLYERLGFRRVPAGDPLESEPARLAELEGKPYIAMRLNLTEKADMSEAQELQTH